MSNTATIKKPRQKNKKKKNQAKGNQKDSQKVEIVVTTPVAQSKTMVHRPPKLLTKSLNSTRIRHREYITSLTASGVAGQFQIVTYAVNPGMSSFTWLSGIARNWEKYLFHSLKYIYIPRCPTSLPGSVMMAVDYDAADANPISDQVLMSYDSCIDTPVWKECTLICPSHKLSEGASRRYCRHAVLSANLDIKTYDVGKLIVATSDSTVLAPLGRVFVEYDVEFFIPQVPPEGPEYVMGVNSTGGGTLDGNKILGSVPVTQVNSIASPTTDGTFNYLSGLGSGTFNLTQSVVGTGLGALGAPSILSGPGIVQTLNAALTNAAGNTAFGQWAISNVSPDTNIKLSVIPATTVTGSNLRLNRMFQDIPLT